MDAYVPVYSEGGNTWFPANDAASELVYLVHIWEDISKINVIRLSVRDADPIADKLLLKYILVEFFSVLDHARKLQGIVRCSPKLVLGKPAPDRYITKKDSENIAQAYKNLWKDLAPLEPLIADIRNNIGAHRSAEIGDDVEKLWKELNADRFVELLNRIPELISIIREANIFNWSWVDTDRQMASIFGCRIVHEWKHAFTPEEAKE